RKALHRRSLPAPAQVAAAARRAAVKHAAAAGAVYTGLGFDVCSAPSQTQMTAWSSTRYHAIGIYLGGVNSACSQPNLTPGWVSNESAAGWHMIPTYVGLQAPGACGCSTIKSGQASAEGTAAASDAVARAQALGIGAGNPIYYDMEAYPRGGTTTSSVLSFLAAWTSKLHGLGYVSGVYSSGGSGIADLAARWGTGYAVPDDLWIADWNNKKTTSDPYVPANAWPSHQRLHQYSGGRSETHGGVTLDIDGDYLDGSTAGVAVLQPALAPAVQVSPGTDGSIRLNASWPGATGITAWQVLAGSNPQVLVPLGTPINGGPASALVVHSQFPYFTVEALAKGGQVLGTAPAAAVKPHLAVYGKSAFVPTHGAAGLPVGCFTGADCSMSVTATSGKSVVATGQAQRVSASGGGILHFKLTSAGRSALSAAHGHLSVKIRLKDASGTSATTTIKLVSFATAGATPARSVNQARTLRFMGVTDFVYRSAVGGILAACPGSSPCDVSTTIRVGGRTIATAGPQFLGANELGYLNFKLTPAGRNMLANAHGNKLGVSVTLTDENSAVSASAHLVLVSYR